MFPGAWSFTWGATYRPDVSSQESPVTVNESDLDRLIRAGIAVTALGTGMAIGGIFNPIGIGLFGVAGMAAFTAVSGYCPLYALLGVSTCPVPEQD